MFNQPPDLGSPFNHDGKTAKKAKGIANANANPAMPTAGPVRLPKVTASTNKVPIIGPVQENDTNANVNAMKKMLINPVVFPAFESIALVHLLGNVISNAPKNEMAKNTRSKKKKILKMAFVDISFNLLGPNAIVINKPKSRYITTIDKPYTAAWLIAFLRLLFFFKKKLFQYVFLAYTYYYIIISMKRGAILIGLFSLLYFLYERYNNANKRERYGIVGFTLILTMLGFYFLQSFYLSSDYFQSRFESTLSGDASNRDVFYLKLIQYYMYQTSFFEFIFGSGADYTIKILGNYAHNDWLEILINNGFFGVLIYLFLYISLFRAYLVKSVNMPDHVRNAFFVTIFIMASKTLFSMSYSSLGVGIPICLGYCLAYDTKNININKFKS